MLWSEHDKQGTRNIVKIDPFKTRDWQLPYMLVTRECYGNLV